MKSGKLKLLVSHLKLPLLGLLLSKQGCKGLRVSSKLLAGSHELLLMQN
jgi:hypothetical protein